MKHLTLFIFFISLNFVFCQTECKNNVSTNYTSPQNNSLPSVNPNYFLNGTNWFPVVGGLYDDLQLTNMTFGGSPLTEMSTLMVDAYIFYNYIWHGPEPLNENGWELLLVNLGRYPDDVTPIQISSTMDNKPYVVLYNRYSGVIRIFINFGSDFVAGNGPTHWLITMTYDSEQKINGIYRYYSGHDKTLNENTSTLKMSAVCPAPAEGRNWASVDFKIAYDPCVCYYPSKLRFDFRQIQASDIKLHGRAISIEDDLTDSQLGSSATNFLNGFDVDGNSPSGDGIIMHKAIQGMINDYEAKYKQYLLDLAEVGEHNAKVKQNYAVLRMAKFVVGAIAVSATTPPAIAVVSANAISLAINEANQTYMSNYQEHLALYQGVTGNSNLADINWFEVVKNMQEGIVKITAQGNKIIDEEKLFKYVKKIFGEKGQLFISNNFEYENLPNAPTPPTAVFTEMSYVGTSTITSQVGGFSFYTPGTYGSSGTGFPNLSSPYSYPVYNEVLGVFALLEKPKIKVTKRVKDYETNIQQCNTFSTYALNKMRFQRYESWTKEYQITLVEDLKYAFNDVLDIDNYTIEASFNVKAMPEIVSVNQSFRKKVNVFTDPSTNVNIESTNFNSNIYDSISTDGDYFQHFLNDFDYYSFTNSPINPYQINPATHIRDTLEIQTPYIPIDALNPFVFSTGIKNEVLTYSYHEYSYAYLDDYPHSYNSNVTCGDSIVYQMVPNAQNIDYTPPVTGNLEQAAGNFNFDIELKLIVDIEFNTLNSNGKKNKATYVLTFPIDNGSIIYENNSYIINDLSNNPINLNYFNIYNDRLFNTTTFSGQNVAGCNLNGNYYRCPVNNNITIDGDINVASGYHVDFVAGNEINVINESNISPEVVLMIQNDPMYDYSHPMPKATQDEVYNFCQNPNLYLAREKSAKLQALQDSLQHVEQEEKVKEQIRQDFDFSMYPNPTTNQANIFLDRLLLGGVNISVKDVAGKTIEVLANQQNDNTYVIDVNTLESGIYFVTVSSFGYSKTKRLVITK